MKKITLYILLLVFTGCLFFSQEIFQTKEKKYLFIGSVKKDSLKVFTKGEIKWISNKNLNQVDKLTSKDFLEELFSKQMEGYEPFWSARIYKNFLYFKDPETGVEKKYIIKLVFNSNKVDSGTYFSFSDEIHKISGYINYIGLENKETKRICEYNLSDEDSLYEAFITINGTLYRGCSVIIKKK